MLGHLPESTEREQKRKRSCENRKNKKKKKGEKKKEELDCKPSVHPPTIIVENSHRKRIARENELLQRQIMDALQLTKGNNLVRGQGELQDTGCRRMNFSETREADQLVS
jgi:hypothetical protein